MSILDSILNKVLDKYDIDDKDIAKVKRFLDKVKFTKIDGEDYMLIEIGDGIELKIKQKKKKKLPTVSHLGVILWVFSYFNLDKWTFVDYNIVRQIPLLVHLDFYQQEHF